MIYLPLPFPYIIVVLVIITIVCYAFWRAITPHWGVRLSRSKPAGDREPPRDPWQDRTW